MAQKGVNTLIVEAKDNLTNAINDCIKTGIPAVMVSIMLENILHDLNSNVKKVLEMEQQEYEQQVSLDEGKETDTGLFRMTQIRSITTNDGFKDGYVMLNVTKL